MPSELTREQLRKMNLVDCGDIIVERDTLDIARRIIAYDPNLRVQYLSRDVAVTDPPFRIVERCPDGLDRIVFTCWELDERVLDRVYKADTNKHDINARLDTLNEIAKKEEKRKQREARDEASDMVAHIVGAQKSSYTVEDKDREVTFFDDRPAEVKVKD